MDGGLCLVDRDGRVPEGADFCLTVDTDDMAPYIRPGDRVYVSCRQDLEDMDAGLFYVDGRVLCRQYCEDYSGTLHLLCANPLREDRNLALSREKRGELICLGKLLLAKHLPPPVYGKRPVVR